MYGDIISGLVAEHALTRSVRDSAALLDATSGPDAGDPYWAPPPARRFLKEVGANPGRLRIAFTAKAATGAQVHEDCVKAVREAADLCAELGHEVEEAEMALDGELINQAFIAVWAGGCAWTIDDWARRIGKKPTPDQFEPLTWALQEAVNPLC